MTERYMDFSTALRPTTNGDSPKEYDFEELLEESERGPVFEFLSGVDLAAPVEPMSWLVQGVWAVNSYGALGGKQKSIKSYTALALAVAVASGRPMLGEFEVHKPGPVVIFMGEGGEKPFRRRWRGMCRAYGISDKEMRKLPVHVTTQVAPLDSPAFQDTLQYVVEELQPVLVILDSLYAYHPPKVEVSNLYQRGPMLARLSEVTAGKTALLILDHFNKSSTGTGLDEFAQSGMGAWVDSWIGQRHCRAPDLDNGNYYVNVEIGSRQWGGLQRSVKWHIPPGLESGEAGDPITFAVGPWVDSGGLAEAKQANLERELHEVISAEPYTYTTDQLAKKLGKGKEKVREALEVMRSGYEVEIRKVAGPEGARVVKRDRWGIPDRPNTLPVNDLGTGSNGSV